MELENLLCSIFDSFILYWSLLLIIRVIMWGAAKTVHMGQIKNFEITTWPYSSAFSEHFVLYLKVLAILVPEI